MDDKQQASALHEWYSGNFMARKLPWRQLDEPTARVLLVEGLLAQTRAADVAEHYAKIFIGIQWCQDWLDLPAEEQARRVAPLGLPRLKVAAMRSIAAAFSQPISGADKADPLFHATLTTMPGIGPYTASMLLMFLGVEAVPVDVNVDRVGARVDAQGDAPRWMAAIVDGVRGRPPETGYHPFYEVTCAVLDLGATLCGPRDRRCGWCPVRRGCHTAQHYAYQGVLFDDPREPDGALEDTQQL